MSVKVKRSLTRQDLLDDISELRQKVIKLQSEIIRLRQPDDSWPIMPNDAPWQPYVYPYHTTGDPLPPPNYTICYS